VPGSRIIISSSIPTVYGAEASHSDQSTSPGRSDALPPGAREFVDVVITASNRV
jgi:hypothetical protein